MSAVGTPNKLTLVHNAERKKRIAAARVVALEREDVQLLAKLTEWASAEKSESSENEILLWFNSVRMRDMAAEAALEAGYATYCWNDAKGPRVYVTSDEYKANPVITLDSAKQGWYKAKRVAMTACTSDDKKENMILQ